jgi:hypothetical protein
MQTPPIFISNLSRLALTKHANQIGLNIFNICSNNNSMKKGTRKIEEPALSIPSMTIIATYSHEVDMYFYLEVALFHGSLASRPS